MCNTGVGLTPLVDGKVHHFEFRGVYDGVSILGDRETEPAPAPLPAELAERPIPPIERGPTLHSAVSPRFTTPNAS